MKPITSVALKLLVILLIVSGAFAIPLRAQDDAAVTVSIPFPFIVGEQNIAPGTYQFDLVSQILLSVTDVKTGHEQVFLVRPDRQRAFEPHGRLVFGIFDGHRRLNEIHFPGTNAFSDVIQHHNTSAARAGRCAREEVRLDAAPNHVAARATGK